MIGIVSPRRSLAAWLLSCAAAVTPLKADVVMNLRTTDYAAPTPRIEETRMAVLLSGKGPDRDSGMLKMDITSPDRDHTLVFRGGENPSITVIDHRRKSFSIIDRESMAAYSAEMRMLMQATAMRVESLPPEQRTIVKKMLESRFGPDPGEGHPTPGTVIRTGERDTLSGLPCTEYGVFEGGKKLREVWVAPPTAVRGGEPALALLREMSDFYGTLMGSFEQMAQDFGGSFGADQNPFEDLTRMHGFPVLTRNFADGRVDTEIALLSIEEQRLSAAEFEPPEGYSAAAMAPGPTRQ